MIVLLFSCALFVQDKPLDYAAGLKESLKTGKPLVVVCHADWCPGCRQLKAELKTVDLSSVVLVFVDVDKQGYLFRKGKLSTRCLGVTKPTTIPRVYAFDFLPDGRRVRHVIKDRLKNDLQRAVNRLKPYKSPVRRPRCN